MEQAHRVGSIAGLILDKICYWKLINGSWRIHIPGPGLVCLKNHTVSENDDGSITVEQRIVAHGHDYHTGERVIRRGKLTKGAWEELDR